MSLVTTLQQACASDLGPGASQTSAARPGSDRDILRANGGHHSPELPPTSHKSNRPGDRVWTGNADHIPYAPSPDHRAIACKDRGFPGPAAHHGREAT